MERNGRLPLEGVRVLDLTMFWAGPSATFVLGSLGAEVIKVEAVQRPDGFRVMGIRDEPRWWEKGGSFNQANVNKYGVTLDLTREEGKSLLKEMAKISDIVIDSYSARVMKNLGLGYDVLKEMNPTIIMLSMPGFGQTGPWRNTAAFALNLEQSAGIAYASGYEGDIPMPVRASDPIQGYFGAIAAMLALYHRRMTGVGQCLDYAQMETLAHMLGPLVIEYTMNGRDPGRIGNRDEGIAPQGCYRAQGEDEWIALSIRDDKEWQRFCHIAGHPEWANDDRFATVRRRLQHHDELDRMIGEWTSRQDKHQAMKALQDAGIPAGAVFNEREIIEDPHLNAREWFQTLTREVIGTKRHTKPAMHFSKTPIYHRRPAPLLGEHNELILGELLGLSKEGIGELAQKRVIGREPAD